MEPLTLEAFQAFAARMVQQLSPRTSGATVIALSGDLGAGKTTFAQAAAKTLGIEEVVTSPTFVIEKIYQLQHQAFERLVHIDAYRLEAPDELEKLGFRGLLSDPLNVILIEWPERVAALIPENAIRIRFDIQDGERIITIDGESAQG